MPFDSYFNNLNDKSAVIFDIGSAYTKLGFSGECSPRAIIPSIVQKDKIVKYLTEASNDNEERELLICFLYEIYYRKLLVNPKDRRVVVLESILSPSKKRDILANVLFKHFEVPSILFAPTHLVALFTIGLQSGLVLDCGYTEANIVPVFEGYHLIQNWQAASLGGVDIEKHLLSLIKEGGRMTDASNKTVNMKDLDDIDAVLSRDVLEDIKVRSCVVSPMARAEQWRLWLANNDLPRPATAQESFEYSMHCQRYGDVSLTLPIEVREFGPECLFDNDQEEMSLARLVLDAIVSAPIDCKKVLCDNLVVVGGTSQLPGFRSRLLAELKLVAKTVDKYRSVCHESFKMHDPPSLANFTAWLGGAIFGDLDTIAVRSLTREAYLEHDCKLVDWTDHHRSR